MTHDTAISYHTEPSGLADTGCVLINRRTPIAQHAAARERKLRIHNLDPLHP